MLKIYTHPTGYKQLPEGEPLVSLDPTTFKTFTIPHPDFERIKKVLINRDSCLKILSESGIVYIHDENRFKCSYLLDTKSSNENLIIDDISTFSEGSTLYLARDSESNHTFLYGSGTTTYDCFGDRKLRNLQDRNGTEKFTLLYTPQVDENGHRPQITHIASCHSFKIMVLDHREIRISGQNWVNSSKEMNWNESQFVCEKKIKNITCGSFQFMVIFEDDSVMFCGDNQTNQMPHHTHGRLHFTVDDDLKIMESFGGYDSSVVRFAHTPKTPESYKIYGETLIRFENLKEFLKNYPIFTVSNENDFTQIRYLKKFFVIEFQKGLFYFMSNDHTVGFTVDMSTEFHNMYSNHYEVVALSNTIVFYKTNSKECAIYPELHCCMRNKLLTDCDFDFI
ncbi:predicted protein [Naegleria gruberi]|uniref:Predicted protein n=1 Tax=Naegleria gruberi TaxID=5762 RepID=D2VDB9_NAEGR|nr:uncharacterized protein NAEGRDRAFT_66789 [Naegleria gruberi]EFC45117.1 predicted protein [Naegleria gruberi]|eukprot:XP_002677861.1 predicted protein [Naegleria gruberi strain NEG-M]